MQVTFSTSAFLHIQPSNITLEESVQNTISRVALVSTLRSLSFSLSPQPSVVAPRQPWPRSPATNNTSTSTSDPVIARLSYLPLDYNSESTHYLLKIPPCLSNSHPPSWASSVCHTVSLRPNSQLAIPQLTYHTYTGPFTHEVSQILRLSNPTNQAIAFKVKTTAPKQYVCTISCQPVHT
jgi:hypothetical protein